MVTLAERCALPGQAPVRRERILVALDTVVVFQQVGVHGDTRQ